MAVFGTLVSMGGSSKVSHLTCLIPNSSFPGLQPACIAGSASALTFTKAWE